MAASNLQSLIPQLEALFAGASNDWIVAETERVLSRETEQSDQQPSWRNTQATLLAENFDNPARPWSNPSWARLYAFALSWSYGDGNVLLMPLDAGNPLTAALASSVMPGTPATLQLVRRYLLEAEFGGKAEGVRSSVTQAQHVQQIVKICRMYMEYCMTVPHLKQSLCLGAIKPLKRAVEMLQENEHCLTPVHHMYMRVCLEAKAYHMGVVLADQRIFDIMSLDDGEKKEQVGRRHHDENRVTDYLLYFYYAGLVYLGLKQYKESMHMFFVCIWTASMPTTKASQIQLQAHRKWMLLGSLTNSKAAAGSISKAFSKQVENTMPSLVRASGCRPRCYDTLSNYLSGQDQAKLTLSAADIQQFDQDKNLGLVKQTVEAELRHTVKKLEECYTTVTLSELIKAVQTSRGAVDLHAELPESNEVPVLAISDQTVEGILLDMVAAREISMRVDHTNGTVKFPGEDRDTEDEQEQIMSMHAVMQEATRHGERLHELLGQKVVEAQLYAQRAHRIDDDTRGCQAMFTDPPPVVSNFSFG